MTLQDSHWAAEITRSEGPVVYGWARPEFWPVVDAFESNFRERGELGASFAAVVDGAPVVDIWGGLAQQTPPALWRADTIVPIFSGTKGLVSTCMLILIDRGQLDLDAPVSAYWPEFGKHGKEEVLVGHVLSHRAGLPGVSTPISVLEATDDVRMAQLLADQEPVTPPGAFHAYHALTMGWLCGELVRRVDGRSVGRFFAEEVAQKLQLEAWIGLPEDCESRVARLERRADFDSPGTPSADADPIGWSIWANPPRYLGAELAANMRVWREAEVPASSGVADARSMARLYGCLAQVGTMDGVPIVSRETLALAAKCLASGGDPFMGIDVAYSAGFQVQTEALPFGPPRDAFGYGGFGGSLHGCWPSRRTGFSYAMNLLAPVESIDPRAAALLDALHSSLESIATDTPVVTDD